jgi:glycolate oxidase iron-sulfur subunit
MTSIHLPLVETSVRPCALPGSPLAAAGPGLDACVHCGFCLQACPTYLALDDENDSPRGRLVLMRALLEGDIPTSDPAAREHLDRCLGCRGCESACPSGVPYGALLEATRATLASTGPRRALIPRVILFVFAREWLLRPALLASRIFRSTRIPELLARVPGPVGAAMAMLASSGDTPARRPYTMRGDGSRGRAALLTGCVMDGLFAQTNLATERTLAANDWEMVSAPGQRCCGALHAHAGDVDTARTLAKRNIEAFERTSAETIVVNAAGCGAMMKEYPHLFAGDSEWQLRAARVAERVRDVTEMLAEAGPRRVGVLAERITYDAPCHLMHAQRVLHPPIVVLAAIEGLTLVPLTDLDQCCGGAGLYSLSQPEIAAKVLDAKIRNIDETGARWVATGNPGCIMQIGIGLRRTGSAARAVHPVDLLDAAYAAAKGSASR